MHADLMNTIETHIDRATIQAIAQLIVERFNPEQVILFGSHARGEVGEHSDVDLLVVLRDDAGGRNAVIQFVGRLPSTLSCPLMSLSAPRKSSLRSAMTRIPLSTPR